MTVDEHYQAGKQAWPDVEVASARYASELVRRDIAVEAVKGADLYLTVGCCDGNARAIEIVRELLASEVRRAASKSTATRDQVSEIVAGLSCVLFVDEPTRPAALRAYSARGDLKSYLRVIATREVARFVNRARREVPVDDDDFMDRIIPNNDPEISMMRERYRADVDEAMRAALRGLDERERALLRYAFVEGLNVDSVGKLYGVHRATAARWIAAAREELGTRLRDELATRLKIAIDEVDSIVRLVQSRISVSIDRILRT